jgi:SPP1 gp7 family putative phage head morphogenesis protein
VTRAETIAAIRTRRAGMKAIGVLPRRRRPPPQLQPNAVRIAYFGAIVDAIGRARTLVRERLVSRLPAFAAEAALERMDGLRRDAWAQSLNDLLDSLSDAWFAEWPNERLRRLAEVFGERTSDFQREQLAKQMKATLGIDVVRYEPWLRPKIATFTGENVALIKSVASDFFGDLEKRLVAGLRSGQRWEALADEIEERYGVTESRAKLVARDQVGKLYGDLNRTRQTQLGVSKYRWRTMRDNRVRDGHELREGEEYSWDEPPEDGHPGEPINCRCNAEPVLDELLENPPDTSEPPPAEAAAAEPDLPWAARPGPRARS